MSMALQRSPALFPVCRQASLRLAGFPAGEAGRVEKAEGKIEETGTLSGRFPKLSLSAHWLAGRARHPPFSGLVPRFCSIPAFAGLFDGTLAGFRASSGFQTG